MNTVVMFHELITEYVWDDLATVDNLVISFEYEIHQSELNDNFKIPNLCVLMLNWVIRLPF